MVPKLFFYSLVVSLLLSHCNVRNKSGQKLITIASVSFEIPDDFAFVEKTGVDNRVYEIVMDNSSRIVVAYGSSVYSLTEHAPQVFSFSEREIIMRNSKYELDTTSIVYSETAEEDKKENIYSKNYYYYDTINGLRCKIVKPKRVGDGMTGLLIRNIMNNNSISMYTENLDSSHHEAAIRIFSSIRKTGEIK